MKIKRIMLVLIFCIVLNQPLYAAELEDTYISQYQRDLCIYYGIEYGICPELLMALIEVESSGRQSAVNGTCAGICQINSAVWGKQETEELQIIKCCEILLIYLDEEPDIGYALGKYNGDSRTKRLYEAGKNTEYAEKILDRTYELETIHGFH